MNAHYDFGYSWPWTYGHLVAAVVFAAVALIACRLRAPWWLTVPATALVVWALASFVIVRTVLRINRPVAMPTAQFLPAGAGRVLDVGAGSGRSALMVLLTRPGSRVVALDNFSADYIKGNGPERLHANARAAGVDDRLEVQAADMRSMPLPSNSFDAALSAYAIDHLNAQGIDKTMSEIARVLRPGGQFLMMTINRDHWVRFTYPFLHGHTYYGRTGNAARWRKIFETAGFEVVEEGDVPATLYILGRKK